MKFWLTPSLIAALIIALIAIVFALQNPASTTIEFLAWQFQAPLALGLFITLFLGILVGILSLLPSLIRKEARISRRDRKIKELKIFAEEAEEEVIKQQKRVKYLEERLPSPLDNGDFR